LKKDGQVETSRNLQVGVAAIDCTGMCFMAAVALVEGEGAGAFLNAINAKFGTQLGPADIPALGIRVLKAEREFNKRAGFTEKDDRLPRFYYEEPLPPHNKVFLMSDQELDSVFGVLEA
jgi:aldehyde:ferredoxin oxidoreductase